MVEYTVRITIHMALNKNTCKSISKLLSDMNIRYTVGVRDKIDVLYISNFDGIVKFSKLYLEASSRHAVLSRKRDKFMDILGT